MGFDKLDDWQAGAGARFEDEEFSVHIHRTACEGLAFLERKSSGGLAAGRPPTEKVFGRFVPFWVGGLGLWADAITSGVNRHVGDDFSHKSGISVEVARTANQLGANAR